MVDVLTWVMQRRLVPADRADRLRKELADLEVEVARLEAAEVVSGRFVDAERAGQTDDPSMTEELERVTASPAAKPPAASPSPPLRRQQTSRSAVNARRTGTASRT